MDNTLQNKMTEMIQIERFVNLLGFTKYDLSYPDIDPPDALIKSNGGLISLEHTRIIIQEERAVETIRKRCIRQAKAQWTKCKLPTIRVDVFFNDRGPESYSQINQYSTRIHNLLSNFVGPLHDFKSRIGSSKITCHAALSIQNITNNWSCVNNHIGWKKRISESRIQDIISRKSEAITKYQYNCIENWLLIFIESEYASSMFHLETTCKNESKFSRIFLSNGFEYMEIQK